MIELKGLKLEQLLEIDTRGLTRQELAQLTTKIGNTVNRRIKSIESSNVKGFSIALEHIKESGGKITAKGKDRQQLQLEIQRARSFVASKTSSVRGAKKYQKLLSKIEGRQISNRNEVSSDKHDKFITVLNKLKEYDRNFFEKTLKYELVINEISENLEMSEDDLLNTMFQKMQDITEQEQEILSEMQTNPFEL